MTYRWHIAQHRYVNEIRIASGLHGIIQSQELVRWTRHWMCTNVDFSKFWKYEKLFFYQKYFAITIWLCVSAHNLRLIGIAEAIQLGKYDEKGVYFNVKAMISTIKTESALYKVCDDYQLYLLSYCRDAWATNVARKSSKWTVSIDVKSVILLLIHSNTVCSCGLVMVTEFMILSTREYV
jgi:hypothetical protein